jgi:glucose/arabinose dehydrogenase
VNGVVESTPFLDATALIAPPDAAIEKGLLGLAFHPSFAQNGRFFVYYNAAQSNALTLVELARTPGDPDTASATPVRTFFSVVDGVQTNHNGGMLAFGPDGYLYVGVGDGGGAGDPNDYGQDLTVKLGKILRIDVDNYPAAPAGNVTGGDPDIWDYGLRNPWRFSFDRCKGDLYIGDVGQNTVEEIDVEPKGQGRRNYGWSVMEGSICFKPNQLPGCADPSLVPPTREYPHTAGCSVNGGYVYRGSAIPALRGTYLYCDYCANHIWSFVWKDGAVVSAAELPVLGVETLVAPSSFGEDASGELYVVDLGGVVYRLDPG